MLALRPMTDEEYTQFMAFLEEDYPRDRSRNLGTPLEEERAASHKQINDLLPQGVQTPGHFFWMVVDEGGGAVGRLWVAVDAAKGQAFIYDIAIDAARRGNGYGRQTLELLDTEVRRLGLRRIALNVFGDNSVAQHLYRTAGYHPVAILMRKDL